MNRLEGKVAIVTDASGPIGAACVGRLHAEGAHVVAAGTGTIDGASLVLDHDATLPSSWQALVSEAASHGGPHVLVNVVARVAKQSFVETTPADLKGLVRENAVSGWLGMKEVVPAIRGAGGGYVVNVLPTNGRAPDPDAVASSALAGGLRVATKSVALECAKQTPRVMVNAVLVGDTEATIDPAEAAAAVAHFSCDDGAYLTGMEIYVDNGWSLAGAR